MPTLQATERTHDRSRTEESDRNNAAIRGDTSSAIIGCQPNRTRVKWAGITGD